MNARNDGFSIYLKDGRVFTDMRADLVAKALLRKPHIIQAVLFPGEGWVCAPEEALARLDMRSGGKLSAEREEARASYEAALRDPSARNVRVICETKAISREEWESFDKNYRMQKRDYDGAPMARSCPLTPPVFPVDSEDTQVIARAARILRKQIDVVPLGIGLL